MQWYYSFHTAREYQDTSIHHSSFSPFSLLWLLPYLPPLPSLSYLYIKKLLEYPWLSIKSKMFSSHHLLFFFPFFLQLIIPFACYLVMHVTELSTSANTCEYTSIFVGDIIWPYAIWIVCYHILVFPRGIQRHRELEKWKVFSSLHLLVEVGFSSSDFYIHIVQ